MKSIFIAAAATLAIAASTSAIASEPAAVAPAEVTTPGDVVATAKANPQFRTLAKAIEAAGLEQTLRGAEAVTLFAPTDAAFARLPAGTLEDLMKPENREQLKALLTGHVVPGYATAEFLSGQKGGMETVSGGVIMLDNSDGVTVSGAKVVEADVRASNGLIHAIDQVILPAGPVEATAGVAAAAEGEGSRPE